MIEARKYGNRVEEIYRTDFSRSVPRELSAMFSQCCETQRKRDANQYASAIVWAMIVLDVPFDLSMRSTQENYLDLVNRIMGAIRLSSDPYFDTRITVMWKETCPPEVPSL